MENIMDAKKFSEMIVKELTEMKKIGMRVPKKAITYASNPDLVSEYMNMKVSEAADLVLDLA
jgi:hypothetical protein